MNPGPGATAVLHRGTIVVEGHAHVTNAVLTQGLDPWVAQPTGTIDFARAKLGGVNVIVEHLFVEDRYNDYNYAVKQACRLIETFYAVLEANPERMGLARTSAEAREIVADGRLAIILALEGGFDTEGDLDVLRLFHRLGVRMVQLTSHDTTNSLIDAYAGERRWGGLSDQGRAVIREMNRLGVVIDISHATDEAKAQAIEASGAPVVTSHNGLRHFAQVIGNLDDDLLTSLAARGGLVGLHSAGWIISQEAADWNERTAARRRTPGAPEPAPRTRPPEVDYGEYVGSLDAQMRARWTDTWGYGTPWRQRHDEAVAAGAPLPTVQDWAEQVAWVVRLVGPDHVGLGLDLMAGGNWLRDFDAASYPRLTEALAGTGVADDTIVKVLGENWFRIFDAAGVP